MIYTKKKYLTRYMGQNKSLDLVIRAILRGDSYTLGKTQLDADNAYVSRSEYDTMPEQQAKIEGHLRYGDVHVLLEGKERAGVSCIESMTETMRIEEKDFIGYCGPIENWFTMTPEDVLIVYPEDIHMTKVADGEVCHVQKCCFKFKV